MLNTVKNTLHVSTAPTETSCNTTRTSPIFRIDANSTFIPQLQDGLVAFIYAREPYFSIASLLDELPPHHEKRHLVQQTFFTEGLASVVGFYDSESDLELVSNALSKKGLLTGVEVWKVKDSEIAGQRHFAPQAVNAAPSFPDCSGLPVDALRALEETSATLMAAWCRCTQYSPRFTMVVEDMYATICAIVSSLRNVLQDLADENDRYRSALSALHSNDPLPPRDHEASSQRLRIEHVRHLLVYSRAKHRLVGDVIEINSALSYVVSQWFSGISPILQHECPVRSHSLLGLGTAVQGLAVFERFVSQMFEEPAIDDKVKASFPGGPGFNIFRGTPHEVSEWKHFSIDLVSSGSKKRHRPLLTHFSGRRGFRESSHCVTVPMHCLSRCASPRWKLLTLSHELMHAHVRSILGALFSTTPKKDDLSDFHSPIPGPIDPQWPEIFRAFKGLTTEEPDRMMCSRLAIIRYVISYQNMKAHVLGQVDALKSPREPSTAEEFYAAYTDLHRTINELIVHSLDFYYFYDSLAPLYIKSIWSSWCSVPSALENTFEYILRTISAISIISMGQPEESRFEGAKSLLIDGLSSIPDLEEEPLIQQALLMLKDSTVLGQLRLLFEANLYLVDFAHTHLVSKSTGGKLTKDALYSGDQGYTMSYYEFEGITITSPIAFLLGCIINDPGQLQHDEESRSSCWLFCALASHSQLETTNA